MENIDKEIYQLKNLIKQKISDDCKYNIIRNLLERQSLTSGKFIRSKLFLLCEKLFTTEASRFSLDISCAIELMHDATLLHDDVIDLAETRRQTKTLNFVEGNQSAVLAGDFLLTKVWEICSQFPINIIQIMAQAASKTCRAEIMQVEQCGNWQLSENQYFEIIKGKTAPLFAISCRLGAVVAQQDKKVQAKLHKTGKDIGIAYQLADDLLDISGTEQIEGKTLGTDIKNKKITLPVIHFLANAGKKKKAAFIENLENQSEPQELLVQLQETQSLTYTSDKIKHYIHRAVDNLNEFDDCPAKGMIKNICLDICEKAAHQTHK
jgi:octaprenyl-diphosphate synthase